MKRVAAILAVALIIGAPIAATAANEKVEVAFAEFNLKVNGKDRKFSSPPLVHEGRAYVPLREVAEILEAEVGYEASTRTISIESEPKEEVAYISLRNAAIEKKWIVGHKTGKEFAWAFTSNDLSTYAFGFDDKALAEEGELYTIIIRDEEVELANPIKIENGTTLIPLEEIESLLPPPARPQPKS